MKILRSISLISISAFLLTACSKDEQFIEKNLTLELESAVNNPQIPGGPQYVPNEMLVKFKSGTSSAARTKAFGRMAASVKEHIHTAAMKHFGDEQGVFVLKINENAMNAIDKAKAFAEVEYAEPNWIYQHQAISNDPYSLWGMNGIPGTQAATAWANGNTGSSTVWVGIIDEGYMYTHQDLSPNTGTNPGEINGNGIDDDRNGYVDDFWGWDFAGNNRTVYDGTMDDHGTHVAGTIGARGGNGVGVAGVVWNVKLLGGKFLGNNGGTTANAVKAVDYFTNLKTRSTNPLNIVATNNSWGGGGYASTLYNAIVRARNANILFIAAAGNSSLNLNTSTAYPAEYEVENVIAVASITSGGGLSSFSNYGTTSVDIAAPGSSIISTVPGSGGSSRYASYSGTSMAAPHVTGAAALYCSKLVPFQYSYTDIKNKIYSTSSTTGLSVIGGKRLNVSTF